MKVGMAPQLLLFKISLNLELKLTLAILVVSHEDRKAGHHMTNLIL